MKSLREIVNKLLHKGSKVIQHDTAQLVPTGREDTAQDTCTETLNGGNKNGMPNVKSGNNIPVLRTFGYQGELCATSIDGALHLEHFSGFVALNPPAAEPRNTLSDYRWICRTGNKPLWSQPAAAPRNICSNECYPFGMKVQRTETLNGNTAQDTPQDDILGVPTVKSFLEILNGEMTRQEIQTELKLQDRKYLRKSYLQPALNKGLIEMTLPDKPNSKYQKYRLTEKGKQMKRIVKT